MNDEIDFELLVFRKYVDEIISKVNKEKKKYFHLKTVNNFIVHFNELDHSDKIFVYERLNDYLITLKNSEELNEVDTILGKSLFNDQILPIAKVYDANIGFVPYAKVDILVIWLILLSIPIMIFNGPIYFYFFLIAFFFFHYIKLYTKKKHNRVYGYFY